MTVGGDGDDQKLRIANLIDETMFLIETTRPKITVSIFQWFGFARTGTRVFGQFDYDRIYLTNKLFIAGLDVLCKMILKIIGELNVVNHIPNDALTSSHDFSFALPDFRLAIAVSTASKLRGSSKYGSLLGLGFNRISVLGLSSMIPLLLFKATFSVKAICRYLLMLLLNSVTVSSIIILIFAALLCTKVVHIFHFTMYKRKNNSENCWERGSKFLRGLKIPIAPPLFCTRVHN